MDHLLRHGIDEDMPEPDRTAHAEQIADEVLRGRGADVRRRAIGRALSLKDMLRDIHPRSERCD